MQRTVDEIITNERIKYVESMTHRVRDGISKAIDLEIQALLNYWHIHPSPFLERMEVLNMVVKPSSAASNLFTRGLSIEIEFTFKKPSASYEEKAVLLSQIEDEVIASIKRCDKIDLIGSYLEIAKRIEASFRINDFDYVKNKLAYLDIMGEPIDDLAAMVGKLASIEVSDE